MRAFRVSYNFVAAGEGVCGWMWGRLFRAPQSFSERVRWGPVTCNLSEATAVFAHDAQPRAFAVEPQLKNKMTCAELAQRIERLQPTATPQDVARLCLLLTNCVGELEALREAGSLSAAWKRTGLQLQVATDQHAAMTAELEALAASDPKSFDQDQIWVLIRAIKVQSQVLQMYVGHPLLDV
jgi:hypothetical protein